MDTRSTSESSAVAPTIIRASQDLRLPRWVNEPLPDLRAILSANEISRLTRRPRWLLLGLAALGRFPKRRTHCGKPVGWHRADVLDWLTQNMTIETEGTYPLPEAQMDRFMFKINVTYPSKNDELEILNRMGKNRKPQIQPVITQEELQRIVAVVDAEDGRSDGGFSGPMT